MRWFLLCALLAGCPSFDHGTPAAQEDAGVEPDAASNRVKGCLDEVGIWTAPNTQLPCDLVPPGMQL